jgi:hypothetical protein
MLFFGSDDTLLRALEFAQPNGSLESVTDASSWVSTGRASRGKP